MSSPFQTLPDLIVRSIIECMLPPKRTTFGHATDIERNQWRALAPLFHICRIWRIMFLPYLCSDYSIRWVRCEKLILRILLPWTDLFGTPDFEYAYMIRTVSIKLEFLGVIEGMVNSFIYDNFLSQGLVFSGAHTLRISSFYTFKQGYEFYKSEMLEYNASMDGLNKYLGQLLPNVQRTCVTSLHRTENLPIESNVFQAYATFLNNCVKMAKRQVNFVSFRHRVPMAIDNADQCCDLSHIHIQDVKCLECYTLIRRCSSTLTSLSMNSLPDDDISGLIYGSKRNVPIVYSKLRHLDLCIDGIVSGINLAKFAEDVVPFPNLESIHFAGIYPFNDDTPFRGNSKSLQRLDMELGFRLENILMDQKVFSGEDYSQLFWVKLVVDPRRELGGRLFEKYQELVRDIGRYSHVLICEGVVRYAYNTIYSFSAEIFVGLLDVRRLTIRNLEVNAKDVVMLASELPNLSCLNCSLQGLPSSSWLESEEYHTKNDNFETLVVISRNASNQEISRMVEVLTKICPNFRYIGLGWSSLRCSILLKDQL